MPLNGSRIDENKNLTETKIKFCVKRETPHNNFTLIEKVTAKTYLNKTSGLLNIKITQILHMKFVVNVIVHFKYVTKYQLIQSTYEIALNEYFMYYK